ncbi:MAG: transglutaminase domain-containing protein [Saprospiraceae bacterium]
MKTLFTLSLALLAAFSLCAQANYEKADSVAKAFKEEYADAADLALKLTKPFSTEREKARVIFAWVAFNIRYDYKKFKHPPPRPRISGRTPQEFEKNMRELHENEISNTLRSKKGICADYSRLFQKMCEAAKLESVIVTGVSRKLGGKGGGSHAWNAIKIEGKWCLLDATWGAGIVDREDEHFVRRYTPAYFATPPNLFVLNHLPDDEKWQMREKPISKAEFKKQPIVFFSNPDFPLEAFSPENGKIALKEGKAEIRFKLAKMPEVFVVTAGKKREIPAQLQEREDGWAVLTFSPGMASEISVFVGSSRLKTMMLAQFSIK